MSFSVYQKILPIIAGLFIFTSSVFAEKEVVAVHNFNVSASLKKLKVSGWWISEKMENELTQTGHFRIVTRARISRVLKERNISSGPTLKPSALGKMVGAQYIVTGQADYSGNKLIVVANIIDASKQAGEIMESYDTSTYADNGNIKARITELLELLAKKMAMTPGQFLDYGLKMMKQGRYSKAVEAFRDLDREIKRYKIQSLLNMAGKDNLAKESLTVNISQMTSGEAFDYGIELMKKGDLNKAALVFYRLQKSKMARRIRSLMQVARENVKKKEETIEKIISEARRKYENAIVSRDERERKKDPAQLCDEAVIGLRAFLSNPKMFLTDSERSEIENLITEVESFRKKLFAGPSANRGWTIPKLKMEFLPISPGSFRMQNGTPSEDRDEPEYTVTITKPFWMGKYEVTAGQFLYYLKSQTGLDRNRRFTVNKEINFDSKYCPLKMSYTVKRGFKRNSPMTYVSWKGARNFCQWLNRKEREAGRLPEGYEYRLPTEAEWEYCCRAGSKKTFSFGDDAGKLKDYAWYRENSGGKPEICGKRKPNAWGLYDMHGNVWEWCNDWYIGNYISASVEDPVGPDASDENCKVLRGGSYKSSTRDLMCSSRYFYDYKSAKKNIGFRVVCAPEL